MPSFRVLNFSFDLRLPYAEGQTINDSEASELNRLFVGRVAERARAIINSRGAGADPSEVRSELEEMASNYRFTAAPYSLPPDPAEVEALKIARAIATERIARRKREEPLAVDVTKEELDGIVARLAREPRVQAEATRRLDLARSVARDALGALDDLLAPPSPSKDAVS